MNPTDPHAMMRAVLGELSDAEREVHAERLAVDAEYHAVFSQLRESRKALCDITQRDVTQAKLAPGFDGRVLAALRAKRVDAQDNAFASAMSRQFWRVAAPAAAAAIVLSVLAVRSEQTVQPETVSLSSWYALSVDPTSQP